MSTLFKNPPGPFTVYEDLKRPPILRDDHLVLLTIDRLLALCAAFRRWRNRRKTWRALYDLDDRQLRDIGLTREDKHYVALAGSDDARPEYSRRKAKALNVD
jgi:uncharacterized protein YjiS (DUF1127 family)